MTKVLLVQHYEPGLCGELYPVVWSDSLLFGARPWLVFAAAGQRRLLLLVTIWPKSQEWATRRRTGPPLLRRGPGRVLGGPPYLDRAS